MKEQNEEIIGLFRNKLTHAEMPVKEHFWEELERDIPLILRHHKRIIHRFVAAASVLLILGGSSVLFWVFSPKEEIARAFSEVEENKDAPFKGIAEDKLLRVETVDTESVSPVQSVLPSSSLFYATVPAILAGGKNATADAVDADSASFTISMSISITSTGGSQRNSNRNETLASESNSGGTAQGSRNTTGKVASKQTHCTWAVKPLLGTALSADHNRFKMPFLAGVTAERQLNTRLALESGLIYSMLRGDETLHYLGIPLKMNATLAQSGKVALYASAGGIMEKCIGGAPSNSFKNEPVQLAVTVGIGVRYKVSDHLALFAEPGVNHYFDTDSKSESVRTARPTNLNLLCGVRMTY
jgi:hypothetical protein